MAFDDYDFAAFFDSDMPGYALAVIGGVEVPGIFDNAYAESFGIVGGNETVFVCRSSMVSAVVEGTAITITGVAYTVSAVEEGNAGMTALRVEKT